MDNEKLFSCGIDMIYLASCALNSAVPDVKRVAAMELSDVYRLASKHSMHAVTYYALEDALSLPENGIEVDTNLLLRWKEYKNKAVRKLILFEAEREQIFAFMNERGIWHMPLKGVILQKYYPKLGMRQIADNDILFDSRFRRELTKYMVNRGYKFEAGGQTIHDIFQKPPILNFEMHVSLYSPLVDEVWYDYYSDVEKRLLCEEGTHERRFGDDDLYIYIITHALKHHIRGGNGIRSLMDNYVLNLHLGDRLDRSYISDELKKLNGDRYEQKVRSLAQKIFDPAFDEKELDDEEREFLLFFISSGVFGTQQNIINSELGRMTEPGKKIGFGTKIKYLKSKLFPPMEYYRELHPFLYKYRVFIPFFLIFRTVRAPFRRWGLIRSTVKTIFKNKK